MILHQTGIHASQRCLETLGGLVSLVQVQLAFTNHLGYILMDDERVVTSLFQFSIGIIGLTKYTVIASHVTQQAHIVFVRIDIRLNICLSLQLLHIDLCQLVVETQCHTALSQDVIRYRLIEDGSNRRNHLGFFKAVGYL